MERIFEYDFRKDLLSSLKQAGITEKEAKEIVKIDIKLL